MLILLPGTSIPGAAALIGLVLVGKLGSTSAAGLLSLSRVTAGFGAAMLANGPAMATLRTLVNGQDRSSSFKWAVVSRGLLSAPLVLIVGTAISVATGSNIGWAVALGAGLMLSESMASFEVDVLKAEDRFGRASALAAARSLCAWSAAVLVAARGGSFELVILAYLAADMVVVLGGGWRRLSPLDSPVREELAGTWAAVIRINLAGYALNNGDQYLIAALLGPSAVAVYAIGYSLGGGITSLVTAPLAGALGPRIVREWTAGEELRLVARRTARLGALASLGLGAVAAAAIGVAGLLGLLNLLLDAPELAAVAALIAVASAVHAASSIAYVPRLMASRQERRWSRATWWTVGSSVLLVPAMTLAFGLVGTAVATLLAYIELAALLALAFRQYENSLDAVEPRHVASNGADWAPSSQTDDEGTAS